MRKIYIVLGTLSVIALVTLLNCDCTDSKQQAYVPRAEKEIDQSAQGAADYYNLLRANPETGEIDQEIVNKVRKAVNKKARSSSANKNTNYDWVQMGPDNIGGRTRALHVEKDNPNNIWAGCVTGGLYYSSTNGGSYERVVGFDDNPAVSTVTKLGNGSIYVGTGTSFEGDNGSVNNSGMLGHGLFRSTDNGATFEKLEGPEGIEFGTGVWDTVDEVVADPIDDNKVWVAYKGGFGLYDDETLTMDEKLAFGVEDFDITDDGQTIIAVMGSSIRVSHDAGESWTNVSGSVNDNLVPSPSGRNVVAVSPEDGNYMYASLSAGGSTRGVFASVDGGDTWDMVSPTNQPSPIFMPFGSNSQGWYDHCLSVKPGSPTTVFLGGILMHRCDISSNSPSSISGEWNVINSNNYTGGGGFSYVHSDIQTFEWDSNGNFYIGCDGGVFRSTDPSVTGYYPINQNYITTQFYGIGYNFVGNPFGGTQDNGTFAIVGGGITGREGLDIGGGDGFDVEASQEVPFLFQCSQYNAIRKTNYNFQGGGSNSDLLLVEGTSGQGNGPFYTRMGYFERFNEWMAPFDLPIVAGQDYQAGDILNYDSRSFSYDLSYELDQDYNEGDSIWVKDYVQTLFAYGKSGRVYLTRHATRNDMTEDDWATFNISGSPLCFDFSSDGDHMYVGTSSGRVYRLSGLRSAYTSAELSDLDIEQIYSGGVVVTDVKVDPNDDEKLIASRGTYTGTNHVVMCTNASTAEDNDDFTGIWNIEDDLANMPVYSVCFDVNNPGTILAGTEYGIFVTEDEGNSEWEMCNTGEMYKVPIYDLRQQTWPNTWNYGNIYVGSHGAGIFTSGDYVLGVEDLEEEVEAGRLNLLVYPNPVTNIAKFDLELLDPAEVVVNILDMNGKMVRSIPQGKIYGNNTIEFEASDLAEGTYLINCRVENQAPKSGRFVVTR